MTLKTLTLSYNKPLPIDEEIDEFLAALAIGQKILNSKRDYTKCFQINFHEAP